MLRDSRLSGSVLLLLTSVCFIIFSNQAVAPATATAAQIVQDEEDPFANEYDNCTDGAGLSSAKTFTVFSTECSAFHDWQSQTLIQSHRNNKIEGELIRLMSCDDEDYIYPPSSYGKFRVVRTPNFRMLDGDDYSPRNRPNALAYWLNGSSGDKDLPSPKDLIVSLDPDMVYLEMNDLSSVRDGYGLAAKYNLGRDWIKEWAIPFCDGKCEILEDEFDPSYGHPLILTAGDMRVLAGVWGDVLEKMRGVHHGWQTEMYAQIIAARVLGIKIVVQGMMISSGEDDDEIWDNVVQKNTVAMLVAHYCITYSVESFSWSKHDWHDLDIKNCQSQIFRPPTSREKEIMGKSRGGELVFTNGAISREVMVRNREVWLLDKTYHQGQCAILDFYAEFCNEEESAAKVSCGGHFAASCDLCPQGRGETWCNGDCEWDVSSDECVPKTFDILECNEKKYSTIRETLKEMPPHPLDLNCSQFGGQSDHSMQYWNSATPHDLSYKSHFWSDSGNAKYLTFDPGYEGWNNARLYFGECLMSWQSLLILTLSC